MKIASLHSRLEHIALTRPYTIAFKSADAVDLVIVEITTDNGRTGFGCASPEVMVTAETIESCKSALDSEALTRLIGSDVRALPALCRKLGRQMPHTPAARAAVDMALYDLFAQELDLPLADVLGRAHTRLPTSITIGIKPLEATVEEAGEYIDRGFRILKVKCGHDVEEDIARLEAIRGRFGAGIAIRVDPNQGYDVAAIETFLRKTGRLNLEFIEQPAPPEHDNAVRALPDAIKSRIAADESMQNESDAFRLATPPRSCGIFNIKLMKCGGIAPALRIAAIAETAGIDLMWGCMDESRISIAAALHAAFASPATRYLDLDGHLDLERDVVRGGFILKDGMLETTDKPGLGVEAR